MNSIEERILRKDIEIDNKKLMAQKHHQIQGITIHFPYEAYPSQLKYMNTIIDLLNCTFLGTKNGFGALESPTGTGKTLCLLCSTLAWVAHMRNLKKFNGVILYTTRTHSQIAQLIHELNKTCYKPQIAILSSRDFSCVNQYIKAKNSGNVLKIICRNIKKKCPFFCGTSKEKLEDQKNNLVDIEELCKNGKKNNFCPFYHQIEKSKILADVIFMPYNYIFDEDIRNTLNINLKGNIIIIDEAHNTRQTCEEAKTIQITEDDLFEMTSDLNNLIKGMETENVEFKCVEDINKKNSKNSNNDVENLDIKPEQILSEIDGIKIILNKFKDSNIKIPEGKSWPNKGKLLTVNEFENLFIEKNNNNDKLIKENSNEMDIDNINLSDSLLDDLSIDNSMIDKVLFKKLKKRKKKFGGVSKYISLDNIEDHIKLLYALEDGYENIFQKGSKIYILLKILEEIRNLNKNKNRYKSFNFFMSNQIKENHEGINQIRTLNIFCFNPSLCLKDISKENPYAVIFTSGTLCPFNILENEFGIKFDSILENEHIIKQEQFKFAILKKSKSNQNLRFDYHNRNNIEMKIALGEVICTLCKSVKHGGILVFFTSYSFLNNCSQLWNKNNILKKMSEYKTVFIDSPKNNNIINEFIHSKENNSIFMSVFRGKATEGIDFKDDFARMVICIGIPFADCYLDKVQLKREYLNTLNVESNKKGENDDDTKENNLEKNGKKYKGDNNKTNYNILNNNMNNITAKNTKIQRLTGNEWYLHDAMTVVNQSLGRVIRHISDYGALICIDERYDNNITKNYFSGWIIKNNNSEKIVKNDEVELCKELLLFYSKNRNLKSFNFNNYNNSIFSNNDFKNNSINNDGYNNNINSFDLFENVTSIKESTAGFYNKAMQFTPEEMKKFEEDNKRKIFFDENLPDEESIEQYDNSNEFEDSIIFENESEDEKYINNNQKNNRNNVYNNTRSTDNKNENKIIFNNSEIQNNNKKRKKINNINSLSPLDKKNEKINIIKMSSQNEEIKAEYKSNRNEWLQSLVSNKIITDNNIQDNDEENNNDVIINFENNVNNINDNYEKETEEHLKKSEELLNNLVKLSREIEMVINKYKKAEIKK